MDYPNQQSSSARNKGNNLVFFDLREKLVPRRLTIVMWDYAFITRHMSGDSYEKYDEVLDQAVENGYNTVRIDPLPHAIDLKNPNKMRLRVRL